MAVNSSDTTNGASRIFVEARNISGADPLEFLSLEFLPTFPERRTILMFFNIPTVPAKTLELKVEVTDRRFAEFDLFGKPIAAPEEEQNP